MEGMYGISVYIGCIFAVICYNLCMVLYDIIKYGFEKESNFVCVILSITILASIIDDILIYIQYDEFNSNTKRIQELEQRVYYVENKLDDTRTVLLRLQSDFDYYKHRKERNRLG